VTAVTVALVRDRYTPAVTESPKGESMSTKHVDLSAGRIRYSDTGEGPPIVFVHGLLNNSLLWREVIGDLEGDFRCIAPDWPLGSHSIPLNEGAAADPPALAALIGEFLEALDLTDVTLVGNDTGGALCTIYVATNPERVGRLVLTPCDAFDNFLPSMFRPLQVLSRVPPLLTAFIQPLRFRPLQRLPLAFGWLSKRPLPADVSKAFVHPYFSRREIRRDTARVLRGISPTHTEEAAKKLGAFDRPVLIAWAPEDRFFPLDHAKRLAELFPDARLEEIEDSYTYTPIDQPQRTAALIREHVSAGRGAAAAAGRA
jgi:pimeloyl-ACP methyl ester carboxylesterase